MRKRSAGRPKTSETILRLAVFVAESDTTRVQQCVEVYRLSQLSSRPLDRVPDVTTFWRWLKEADRRGVTIEDGRALFQSMKDENE